MDIYWLGHACFRLRSSATGLAVITDPYSRSLGVHIDPRQTQDVVAVTVSHDDSLHNDASDLPGDPRVFNMPGEYEFQGIIIRSVMSPLAGGYTARKTQRRLHRYHRRLEHLPLG